MLRLYSPECTVDIEECYMQSIEFLLKESELTFNAPPSEYKRFDGFLTNLIIRDSFVQDMSIWRPIKLLDIRNTRIEHLHGKRNIMHIYICNSTIDYLELGHTVRLLEMEEAIIENLIMKPLSNIKELFQSASSIGVIRGNSLIEHLGYYKLDDSYIKKTSMFTNYMSRNM